MAKTMHRAFIRLARRFCAGQNSPRERECSVAGPSGYGVFRVTATGALVGATATILGLGLSDDDRMIELVDALQYSVHTQAWRLRRLEPPPTINEADLDRLCRRVDRLFATKDGNGTSNSPLRRIFGIDRLGYTLRFLSIAAAEAKLFPEPSTARPPHVWRRVARALNTLVPNTHVADALVARAGFNVLGNVRVRCRLALEREAPASLLRLAANNEDSESDPDASALVGVLRKMKVGDKAADDTASRGLGIWSSVAPSELPIGAPTEKDDEDRFDHAHLKRVLKSELLSSAPVAPPPLDTSLSSAAIAQRDPPITPIRSVPCPEYHAVRAAGTLLAEEPDLARRFVELGGISACALALKSAEQRYASDSSLLTLCQGQVARCVANAVQAVPEAAALVATCGLLYPLHQWATSPSLSHIRRVLSSTRALYNLDSAARSGGSLGGFADGAYLFYPGLSPPEPREQAAAPPVDVVFVHGLLGNQLNTWRTDIRDESNEIDGKESGKNSGSCGKRTGPKLFGDNKLRSRVLWPREWLPSDLEAVRAGRDVRVLTVGYPTQLREWEGAGITAHAQRLSQSLQRAGVGVGPRGEQRSVVFVAHSMGGLLVKRLLMSAGASDDPHQRAIYDGTRGVLFYATPHWGSDKASMLHPLGPIWSQTRELAEMHGHHENLYTLHEALHDMYLSRGVRVLSLAEGLPTGMLDIYGSGPLLQVTLVTAEDADPKFGEFRVVEDKNHMYICKPRGRDDPVYTAAVQFINGCTAPDAEPVSAQQDTL